MGCPPLPLVRPRVNILGSTVLLPEDFLRLKLLHFSSTKDQVGKRVRENGFRNLRNFSLWNTEYSSRNPEFNYKTIKIQNSSSTAKTRTHAST